MTPALAFNTAISFTTNTSWQNYPGESTLGHLGLAAGLGVQAFASCAVGMCVAIALIRGLVRRQRGELGNFWVDLVRTAVRILIPLSVVVAIILLTLGVVANFNGPHDVSTAAGGSQTILGGPVASWESIKPMSGDGGGAFNVNSAHPFENPTPLSKACALPSFHATELGCDRSYLRGVSEDLDEAIDDACARYRYPRPALVVAMSAIRTRPSRVKAAVAMRVAASFVARI
jgi:K+-transporting ATPase A subunit